MEQLEMILDQMERKRQLEHKRPLDTARSIWFNKARILSFKNDRMVIAVDDVVRKETIEKSFLADFTDAVCSLYASNIEVKVVVGDFNEEIDELLSSDPYTFEGFVIGPSNKLAHAAALAVARKPGYMYNPLFIYGPSGVGKTHLLNAISHQIREDHPNFRIVSATSEDFVNEMIESIQKNENTSFRAKYRTSDLLLIDDIQFLRDKEGTQEEFFHTFNVLYEAGKQVVITSDRPPKEIATLEDRLRSRFEMGMLVDIQPPDYETRLAIIRCKCEQLNIHLPPEVQLMLADLVKSNVRQLEGTVKKIKGLHELLGEEVTVELTRRAIDEIHSELPSLTPETILNAVAEFYSTTAEDILSKNKTKTIAFPRQIAMYLVRDMLEYSYPDIGRIFNRDHTTVMHAIKQIEKQAKQGELSENLRALKNNIQAG